MGFLFACLIIGAALIGIGSGSWCVGIGAFVLSLGMVVWYCKTN